MMTTLCPDANAVRPIDEKDPTPTVTAVGVQDSLVATGGQRLRLLLAGLALTSAIHGLHGGMRGDHRGGDRRGSGLAGHWSNATEADATPTAIAPCAVDLHGLLEAAGVTGIDISIMKLGDHQHGCCGDETCSLGETFDNCAADCTEAGAEGQLVWIRDGPGRVQHGPERGQHDQDGGMAASRQHNEEAPATRADGRHDDSHDDHEGSERTNHAGGENSGRHVGSRFVFVLLPALVSLVLLISIRKSLVAVLRDCKTFLWPFAKTSTSSYDGAAVHLNASAAAGSDDYTIKKTAGGIAVL